MHEKIAKKVKINASESIKVEVLSVEDEDKGSDQEEKVRESPMRDVMLSLVLKSNWPF